MAYGVDVAIFSDIILGNPSGEEYDIYCYD